MVKISGARAPRQEVLSFMTKIDIFSGFLGAGKTTLIKKLIAEAYTGEKIVLIENEFGEIAIDGGFLKDSGVQINEMNSGCICCSLVGDFADALKKVLEQFHPDRILIEPSGVGKLSDVIRAVQGVQSDELVHTGRKADCDRCGTSAEGQFRKGTDRTGLFRNEGKGSGRYKRRCIRSCRV